jgi:hypothetical protein
MLLCQLGSCLSIYSYNFKLKLYTHKERSAPFHEWAFKWQEKRNPVLLVLSSNFAVLFDHIEHDVQVKIMTEQQLELWGSV